MDGRLPTGEGLIDTTVDDISLTKEGDCIPVGVGPSPKAPIHTNLYPSLVHGLVQEPVTRPAHLKPALYNGEMVDPLRKGIKKVLGDQRYIDPMLIEIAINDVFELIGPSKDRQVFSYEEAITGIEGDPLLQPINRRTSPGYPWTLNNPGKGKHAWLGSDEYYNVSDPRLKKAVTTLIDDARNLVRGDVISTATLKDERRPHAKVDEVKTRVFEAMPMHGTIAIRQYFLAFAKHLMKNKIYNESCVGINPASLDWTTLANFLFSKGHYWVAGDCSNFDGSLCYQIMERIGEKISEWYDDGEENSNIRYALFQHICAADVMVAGEVIRQTHSQPSGNPLTVIVNSLFNSIMMRIAYLILKKKQGLGLYCDFTRYVALAVYGDDNLLSISSSIIEWFNQLTITEALAEIGITYTDETKSGELVRYRQPHEVMFLKRYFRTYPEAPNYYFAPMEISNVLEFTNWVRGKEFRRATLDNCENAIEELTHFDESTYTYYAKKIKDALHQVGISINLRTHFEMREKMRQEAYGAQSYDLYK